MGAAEAIPGVSGSTMSFISHIYEELILSLNSLNTENFKLLASFRINDFWKKINGVFLLALLAGFMTSTLYLMVFIVYLLAEYPIQVWAFSFGLILLSSLLFLRNIKKWTFGTIIALLIGVVTSYLLTLSSPIHTPDNLFFLFLSGILVACAILLPGVSGIFILLVFSKYEYLIACVTEFNILSLILFGAGCAVGLIYFSRLLARLLERYHSITITVLAGFMLGSLNKAWPWKEFISYRINATGKQFPAFFKSILPGEYIEKTGKNPEIIQAILFLALGVFLVVFIEKIATWIKTKH